jgi:hypothetical protein
MEIGAKNWKWSSDDLSTPQSRSEDEEGMWCDGYVERIVGGKKEGRCGRWAVRVYTVRDQLAKPSPA